MGSFMYLTSAIFFSNYLIWPNENDTNGSTTTGAIITSYAVAFKAASAGGSLKLYAS